MQYLKYTYVDSVTGVSVTDAPAANGPVPPSVTGLDFDFALESQYPTHVPIFFGTAPDESDVIVAGVIDVIDHAAYESARDTELEARKAIKHRLRGVALENAREAGFTHNGAKVSSDIKSQLLIQGAAQLAQMALADGSQETLDAFAASLNGGWRGQGGVIVATDAPSMIALAQAFAGHVAHCDAVYTGIGAMIDAAESFDELAAIDVADGYAT